MQTKRNIYRIELNEADSIFTDCIIMASLSNGLGGYKPLSKIADHADWLCQKYPSSGSVHTVNRMENVLTIDKGEKNVLTITEIEVLELAKPQLSNEEAKELLSGVPTVDRYIGTGIANSEAHENLN